MLRWDVHKIRHWNPPVPAFKEDNIAIHGYDVVHDCGQYRKRQVAS